MIKKAIISIIFLIVTSVSHADNAFNIGTGIYDITGPAAEEGMMGYALINQKTAGLLQRLWARAFVIESPSNHKRIVIVNADLAMVFQGIQQGVIKQLKEKYGDRYTDENVLLTATHQHSGPGGYATDTLYNLSTLGMNKKNFNIIVDGIVKSIEMADANMQPATIKLAEGDLSGISFNRSPESYLLNPVEEQKKYTGDVDTKMTLLRMDNLNHQPIGMLNWFSIHGVSMNNKNHFINSDNKGLAAYLFEKDFNSNYQKNSFVAGFLQSNAGDVSANPYGHEGGHGLAGIVNIEKAARPQYEKAKELYENANELIDGDIDYRFSYVDMSDVAVAPVFTHGNLEHTCPAAIGVSMLAGTQDGEGLGEQGVNCESMQKKIPELICRDLRTVCQGVKPIVLETGTRKPYPWTPNILPLQIIRIGHLYIIALPFEPTTMAGRRFRELVAKQLPNDPRNKVVISGLSNAYAGYLTTYEEYQLQRYEGASTLFGPWEQAAVAQELVRIAKALVAQLPVTSHSSPANLYNTQSDIQTGVLYDNKPLSKSFGDIYKNVDKRYKPGDTVEVTFWGAHPKNNYHTGDSFLEIQHYKNGSFETILRDRDWGTEYHWQRNGLANSLVTIVWRTPQEVKPGLYRIVHHGDWKSGWSRKIYPYTGYSGSFKIES